MAGQGWRVVAAAVALLATGVAASPAAAALPPPPPASVVHPTCPPAQPRQVGRIPAHEAMLTFDDGPDPRWTPRLLAVLAAAHVHATFFLVGRNAARYPDLVRAIVAAGDVVGNHSWDHADLTRLTGPQLATEIDRTDAAVQRITGFTPCFFRFPYGAATRADVAAVDARGMTPYLWTVDTRDWTGASTADIVATVWRELSSRHGAIVLQHDIQGVHTLDAVPQIIAGLRARHYRFVTATLAHPEP